MGKLAEDNFNRADNADLGVQWSVVPAANALEISNNQAAGLDIGNYEIEVHTQTLPPNQYAQCTVTTLGVNLAQAAACCRIETSGSTKNMYLVGFEEIGLANRNQRIMKFVDNTFSTIATQAVNVVVNDVLRIEAKERTIYMFVNGVQVLSVVDTSHGNGRAGIFAAGTFEFCSVDNFEAGDFITPRSISPLAFGA